MAILTSFLPLPDLPISLPSLLLLTLILPLLIYILYTFLLSPLRHIPGPLPAVLSPFWLYHLTHSGTEATTLTRLHARLSTPVLRIAPGTVSLATGAALHPVYVAAGGFPKAPCYANFDIDGFPTIFSATTPGVRGPRARAVAGLFSMRRIREGSGLLEGVVGRWVERVKAAKGGRGGNGGKLDLLGLTRALAVDAVTAYLFGRRYGGLDEGVGAPVESAGSKHGHPVLDSGSFSSGPPPLGHKVVSGNEATAQTRLSAAGFVDAFVAVGRFFYLPSPLFHFSEWLSTYLASADERSATDASMLHVDQFVTSVVDETVGILAKADEGGGGSDDGSVDTKEVERAADTYQGRLLKVGISKEEAVAQCKDLVFAGTDSTGMNLASCCWFLAGYPEKYSRLRAEVISAPPTTDPQTLPYLSAVIKETLRLGMANPTLLPRVVPPGPGFLVPGTSTLLPPGTTVGLCTYTLHHNPTVFKDPFRFAPERWIAGEGVDGEEGDMETMLRDYFPFGLGARMCIARNLAMQELFLAVRALVSEDVLKAARRVGGRKGSEGEVVDEVEIMEWFNSKVKGERIEICWDA